MKTLSVNKFIRDLKSAEKMFISKAKSNKISINENNEIQKEIDDLQNKIHILQQRMKENGK